MFCCTVEFVPCAAEFHDIAIEPVFDLEASYNIIFLI